MIFLNKKMGIMLKKNMFHQMIKVKKRSIMGTITRKSKWERDWTLLRRLKRMLRFAVKWSRTFYMWAEKMLLTTRRNSKRTASLILLTVQEMCAKICFPMISPIKCTNSRIQKLKISSASSMILFNSLKK